jgi:hypothetical protein
MSNPFVFFPLPSADRPVTLCLQLLANEYFTCKLLTVRILPENSRYLTENAELRHNKKIPNARQIPAPILRIHSVTPIE